MISMITALSSLARQFRPSLAFLFGKRRRSRLAYCLQIKSSFSRKKNRLFFYLRFDLFEVILNLDAAAVAAGEIPQCF